MIKKTPRAQLDIAYFINLVEPQVEWKEFNEGEHRGIFRFDLQSRPEIIEELDKIKVFVKKNYMLREEDIWECIYVKDGLYVGNEYIFTEDENIQGKVSIVFSDIHIKEIKKDESGKQKTIESWKRGKTYFMFRTWILKEEDYGKLCKDLLKLSKKLKLAMVRSIFGQGIGYPKDICLEPIFVRGVVVFDVNEFKNFMKNIDVLAEKHCLYSMADIRSNFYL